MTPDQVISHLKLKPLPEEGGFYRETFRDAAPAGPSACTAIYYFITPESFSSLHAVKKTEIWHFYAGDPAKMLQMDARGEVTERVLGSDLQAGHQPQVRGTWRLSAGWSEQNGIGFADIFGRSSRAGFSGDYFR